MPFTLTADELDRANVEYASLTAQLAAAELESAAARESAWNQSGTDQALHRISNEKAQAAVHLRTRLNSLAAFLHSAEAGSKPRSLAERVRREDERPDPTPPTGAMPARSRDEREVEWKPRTRIACYAGICRVSNKPIHVGDSITEFMSCWALTSEVKEYEARIQAERMQRRNDREYRECFEAFVDRLPAGIAA